MCAAVIEVPAGKPDMLTTNVALAAVILPAASFVVLNVIVAFPVPLVSGPTTVVVSLLGLRSAVNVGCVGDGEDGELLPHAAAKSEAAMASTDRRFIVGSSLIRRISA